MPATECSPDCPIRWPVADIIRWWSSECRLPECLEVTAWTADGTIMAVEHRELPVVGMQFHPESILTECGYALLAAFLRLPGFDCLESARPGERTGLSPLDRQFAGPIGRSLSEASEICEFGSRLILEGIVTTCNADGSANISPMGPEVDADDAAIWCSSHSDVDNVRAT